jgi:hypothetical protein
MNVTVDEFCDSLRDRLHSVEGRLQTVKANAKSRSEEAGKVLRDKLDEARTKIQAQKESMDQLRANLKTRAQQKIAETKEAVKEWKTKQETRKLQARADRAEAYAADAITYAGATIEAAEEAILDAVVARMDADGAK